MNNDYQQKANDYQPDSAARPETAPARQQDRVARQAVKPTYAQSAETPAPARRRRSDRDAQPREDAPQWVRQEPPAAPEADQQVYARRRPALEDEDDYDQEPRGKLWVRALIVMLVIVLGLCAALYFLPDLGPLKGAQQSLRSAGGVEIKVPVNVYRDESALEFIRNPDGSMSLLIKNIIV